MKPLVITALLLGVSFRQTPPSVENCSTIQSMPLCLMLMNAQQNDNLVVTVRGLYLRMPHGAVLTVESCPQVSQPTVNLTDAKDFVPKHDDTMKTLNALGEKRKTAEVVLTGKFHVASAGHGFGQGNESWEIEVSSIQCAVAYDPVGEARKSK